MLHSVDSVKLAARLSRAALPDLVLPVLLEVNVSGEASKDGLAPEELPAAVEAIASLPGLRIEGLMTMAPILPDAELARPVFRQLRLLRAGLARQFPDLPWTHLSMGMTDDFEVAIEEGATLVRIGRAIFGER
jgi:pyridoxal phosphate enzyme (YggS family)